MRLRRQTTPNNDFEPPQHQLDATPLHPREDVPPGEVIMEAIQDVVDTSSTDTSSAGGEPDLQVCSEPGTYPCPGCVGREDEIFGFTSSDNDRISDVNGLCVSGACTDIEKLEEQCTSGSNV